MTIRYFNLKYYSEKYLHYQLNCEHLLAVDVIINCNYGSKNEENYTIYFVLPILIECQNQVSPSLSDEKDIKAFIFTDPPVSGQINDSMITAVVPYETDVSGLVATFVTTGNCSVTVNDIVQISGITINDFSNPIIYTVTAEDGTTQEYTVNVIVPNESSGFSDASSPGDIGLLSIEGTQEILTMVYANDSTNSTFPTGVSDDGIAVLTRKFWIGETEVTNSVMAGVLQWALDNDKFNSSVNDPTGIDITTAKHGGQELINLDDADCHIKYDGQVFFM